MLNVTFQKWEMKVEESKSGAFLASHVVPTSPEDDFFHLTATTLFFETYVPHKIANYLLDVCNLEDEIVATVVTKITPAKYAIKADVFCSTGMCAVKMRMYAPNSQKKNQCALEFQRRGGDVVSFTHFYHFAEQCLHALLGLPGICRQKLSTFTSPFPTLQISDQELQPLLDLSQRREAPSLQAEAARSLWSIAKEGKAPFLSESVFSSILELLKAEGLEVEHYTGSLILHLSNAPSLHPFFRKESFLLSILKKCNSLNKEGAQKVHPNTEKKYINTLRNLAQKKDVMVELLCPEKYPEFSPAFRVFYVGGWGW